MDISRADAVRLFNKWIGEGIPLMVFGEGIGFSVKFSCKAVEAALDKIVLVRKGSTEGGRGAQVEIDLSAAERYRYLDPREAPADVQGRWGHLITGVVAIHLSTSLWILQELGGAVAQQAD
jgi:hypothetical protein